jgi:hypothetical protein
LEITRAADASHAHPFASPSLVLRIHGTAAFCAQVGIDKLVLVYLPKNIAPGQGNFLAAAIKLKARASREINFSSRN